jgi:hypothetical protein
MANKPYQITFNYNLSTLPLTEASKEIFFELTNRKLEFMAEPSVTNSGFGAISVFINYNHVQTGYHYLDGFTRLTKALDTIVEGSLESIK